MTSPEKDKNKEKSSSIPPLYFHEVKKTLWLRSILHGMGSKKGIMVSFFLTALRLLSPKGFSFIQPTYNQDRLRHQPRAAINASQSMQQPIPEQEESVRSKMRPKSRSD